MANKIVMSWFSVWESELESVPTYVFGMNPKLSNTMAIKPGTHDLLSNPRFALATHAVNQALSVFASPFQVPK